MKYDMNIYMSSVSLITQHLYTINYRYRHDDSSLKRLKSYEQPSLSVKHVGTNLWYQFGTCKP